MNGHEAHVCYPESYVCLAKQCSCSTLAQGLACLPGQTRINKGGQFRPTDSNKKSVTVDRQGGHIGKK